MNKILIVIPARYASTRLPGKPLVNIAGKAMIMRVGNIAKSLCLKNNFCDYVVATDNTIIFDFCKDSDINVIMTSEECKNGTERCIEVIKNPLYNHDFIINLQGDNPLCPPWVIQALIDGWLKDKKSAVYTPYVSLTWSDYEKFYQSKLVTPYSGTSVVMDKNNFALTFSKNIIPAIRNKTKAMEILANSPVCKHIGLYAYSKDVLLSYNDMEQSILECSMIEGLEQMRFLYNGYKIKMIQVDYKGRDIPSGVDSPEDVKRVEENIKTFGEFIL